MHAARWRCCGQLRAFSEEEIALGEVTRRKDAQTTASARVAHAQAQTSWRALAHDDSLRNPLQPANAQQASRGKRGKRW